VHVFDHLAAALDDGDLLVGLVDAAEQILDLRPAVR
jgi:hypothetical protein